MTKKRNYPLLQHIRPYAQRMALFICMCLWVVMASSPAIRTSKTLHQKNAMRF